MLYGLAYLILCNHAYPEPGRARTKEENEFTTPTGKLIRAGKEHRLTSSDLVF